MVYTTTELSGFTQNSAVGIDVTDGTVLSQTRQTIHLATIDGVRGFYSTTVTQTFSSGAPGTEVNSGPVLLSLADYPVPGDLQTPIAVLNPQPGFVRSSVSLPAPPPGSTNQGIFVRAAQSDAYQDLFYILPLAAAEEALDFYVPEGVPYYVDAQIFQTGPATTHLEYGDGDNPLVERSGYSGKYTGKNPQVNYHSTVLTPSTGMSVEVLEHIFLEQTHGRRSFFSRTTTTTHRRGLPPIVEDGTERELPIADYPVPADLANVPINNIVPDRTGPGASDVMISYDFFEQDWTARFEWDTSGGITSARVRYYTNPNGSGNAITYIDHVDPGTPSVTVPDPQKQVVLLIVEFLLQDGTVIAFDSQLRPTPEVGNSSVTARFANTAEHLVQATLSIDLDHESGATATKIYGVSKDGQERQELAGKSEDSQRVVTLPATLRNLEVEYLWGDTPIGSTQLEGPLTWKNAVRGDHVETRLPNENKSSYFVFDGTQWVGQGTTPGSEGFYVKINQDTSSHVEATLSDFLFTNPPAGGNPFWCRGASAGFDLRVKVADIIERLSPQYQYIDSQGGVWRIDRDNGTSSDGRRLQLRSPNYLINMAVLYENRPRRTDVFYDTRYFQEVHADGFAPITVDDLARIGSPQDPASAIELMIRQPGFPKLILR